MGLRRPKLPAPTPFPRAVTAATALVDFSGAGSWKTWKFANRDWQIEAWRLYDLIPELHKLTGRIGDSVAKARLYVTEVDETGEETGEVTDERIRRLAAIPLGTGAQRDDCLRLAGIMLAVGGECWIVGEGAAQSPELAEGSWFVVTGAAFSKTGDDVKVRRPQQRGGDTLTLTDGVDILIRCWRPHPNDTDQADSFTRSAIVPLREIELLTKREFAELDSRLTGAGIMFLPEGVDFPREPEDPEGLTGFMALLQRTAAASMTDQSSASAMVPIMATVPEGTDLGSLKDGLVNFWSPLSAEIGEMKDKAIIRVAASAEIPAEVVSGMGDANHWSAWLLSDEGIRWIGTYLALVSDALTRGFLQLAIPRVAPGADPKHYAYAFDTSALAAKPNRLEDALRLRDQFLINDEETVRAAAFDPAVMPSVQERAVLILLKAVQTQPDMMLDPEVQRLLGLPAIKSVGLPATADQNADTEDPDPEAQDGPPNGGEAPEQPDETAEIEAALTRRIALAAHTPLALPSAETVFNAACKLMVMRALELAGGRLATPQERRPSGRWGHVPRHELHAYVGPISRDRAAQVTEGAWIHLPMAAADLGVDPGQLQQLLGGYVVELLMQGRAHHDDFLFAALSIANRGRGLVSA